MMNKIAVGVDLGGTNLRIVIGNNSGKFLAKKEQTVVTTDKYSISSQISDGIRELCSEIDSNLEEVEGVGIASTGPIDLDKGKLVNPTNLPFGEVPLNMPIQEDLKVPTRILNDCTAAVMGERVFGIGRENYVDNIVYVNIGTGIGAGAIVDGNLLLGKNGNAVEIGHMTVDIHGGLRCGCGCNGHWEAYSSGRNIPTFVRAELERMSGEDVQRSQIYERMEERGEVSTEFLYKSVKSGDVFAQRIVDRINKYNCVGFSNIVDFYDPSLITVGGTVALENKDLIIPPIRKGIDDMTRNEVPEIKATPLGEDVGLYGALALAFGKE